MALLTRLGFLAAERPAGYKDLAEFVDSQRAGKIPRTPAMERLADVFEKLITEKIKPSALDEALRLRPARGRPTKSSLRDLQSVANGPICKFIWQRLQASPRRRGATAAAIEAAAAKFNRDTRTIQRAWKRGKPILEADQQVRAWLESEKPLIDLVRRHISPEEMAGEIGKMPFRTVVKIARSRAGGMTASK